MRFASLARWAARWVGGAVLLTVVIIVAAFGLLQTPTGLEWAGQTVAGFVSAPGYRVEVAGLAGTVPFDMRARRITISDDSGVWLTLDDVHLTLAPSDLAAGRLHFGQVTVVSANLARMPETAPAPPVPLAERLRLPNLPMPVAVERLGIERLALAPAVLGEPVEATLSGRAVQRGDTTDVTLDLHRTDSMPGNLSLELRQTGTPATLALRMTAAEPSGLLLSRLLRRSDRPALSASLAGEGPLSDWHGRLDVSAGQLARVAADVTIAAAQETVVTLNGTAALAALLQPEMARLTGDTIAITGRVTVKPEGAIVLDGVSLGLAAGTVTGDLALDGRGGAIAGHLKADLPRLAATSGLVGQPVGGAATLTATIAGTESRPQIRLDARGTSVAVAASGVDRVEAHLAAAWSGDPADPASRMTVTAEGQFRGIAMPAGAPPGIGRDVDWSLSAAARPDGGAVELTAFTARGAGIDIAGSGRAEQFGRVIEGRLRASIADLRPFTGMLGNPVAGALTLDAEARQQTPGHVVATIEGSITELAAGLPALDALVGGSLAISGAAQREAGGGYRIERLTITGAGASISAQGSYDPATSQLDARLDAQIRDLTPVGPAIGLALSGRAAASAELEGTLDHPHVTARVEGNGLMAGPARFDRIQVTADVADAMQPKAAISGEFRSGSLTGALSLQAEQPSPAMLAIRNLRLTAADSLAEADLRIDLGTRLTRGTVTAKAPDLAPWSRLAGVPLSGRIELRAGLEARNGQSIDLTVNGDRLSYGAADTRAALARLALTARLSDVLGTPYGNGRAALSGASFPSGGITSATLTLDSPRPGRFAFRAEAKGKIVEPLDLSLDGTGEIAPKTAAVDVRVSRLAGTLGPDRFRLLHPLSLSRRGEDVAISGLALGIGAGRITGSAARRGAALSAEIAARDLPIAAAARLAGYHDIGGTAGFDVAVGGTLAAPHGRFSLSGRHLHFALPDKSRLPTLGLDAAGTWNGREVSLTGRISGIKGDRLEVSGSAPLVLTAAPFGVSVPARGRLALRLQGSGDIANLADLLPLGEDRFTGRFALDVSVNGTLAAPAADGQLTIADGRYENFATGAMLTGMQVAVIGNRDRLTLRRFSARDSGSGSLAASGSIALSGGGPAADLAVKLQDFRILGRDVAVLAASGTVAITGAIASPKVVARLTTDQGEIAIPDRLPPSVTTLQVIEVPRRAAKRTGAVPAKPSRPALPAALDIRIDLPGQIFVRGRGLDSEWRGSISVTGTSDAPKIVGTLEAVRGTFDFLGKTFRVVRGTIGFDGGAAIDPVLDIAAEVSVADITARVLVTGPASSPSIAITSDPVVPQDEILSRVLFNRGLGQITAGEGIQVAQAAATLAGGGPGILDRLRGRLGLDRLVLGAAPSGPASSNLNPASGGDPGSTSISGGKYIAEGVYVGATQGLTPDSSKVTVEVDVLPHVTVQGDFSQSGGSGIGLNYKYDY
jgi:translocation and assembly module TamB